MGIFNKDTKFIHKKTQPQIQERSSEEMLREYQAKHPSALQRWQQRRAKQNQDKQEIREAVRGEYRKAYIQEAKHAVKQRARKEAKQQYGRTRQERTADISKSFTEIGNIFGGPKNQQAIPQQTQQHQQQQQKKQQQKKKPRSPFDMSELENIGNFDF